MRTMSRLCVTFLVLAAASARAEEALVFAAASTTDVLQELQPVFAKATGHTVVLALGSSGDLARQAMAGAPADAFLSADVARMDSVQAAGLVQPGTRVDLLSNRLVVVVPVDAKRALAKPEDLKGVKRLSLADPALVPAGMYAKAWLEKVGLWTDLTSKVVPALDVRGALAAVEAGRVDAGVVYATDAAQSKKVRVAFEVPTAAAPRIVYPVAALTKGKSPEAGRAFVRFLQSEPARAAFARHGFGVLVADTGTRAK
ncbi:molybdate ABC transporter substrate-binding protein [Myxococcus stipitatus DSM 14675]|uniref:Molybdate ABC transporter substrate-binding protein n=1 Tax=Myxococcus stipitatus (strain DSM 14675 / JCM 12634 / Mx s8) TaxID=1278073 RepID=L7UHR7_MYXSD|nr:molybdate ABC transporter substrate-binding protein [Myxococcus stipitatus]AGC48526.1 molybdate ABC transporter substrate-binding protein [Myxococcus stipitatus DSM 14675]